MTKEEIRSSVRKHLAAKRSSLARWQEGRLKAKWYGPDGVQQDMTEETIQAMRETVTEYERILAFLGQD